MICRLHSTKIREQLFQVDSKLMQYLPLEKCNTLSWQIGNRLRPNFE